MRFLSTIPLRITPLTPVHLGCGEDFEPTNYVIDDGWLHHFDPSLAALEPAQRNELVAVCNRAAGEGARGLLQLQNFFHRYRSAFTPVSRHLVAVAAGVERQYLARVGQVAQREQGRINLLEIERHAHHPHTGAPYIPGSALKGALRTAVLNRLNAGRQGPKGQRNEELQRELLGGAFQTDPFRLIKLSDAAGPDVTSQVMFCINRHKVEKRGRDGRLLQPRGLATRREVIVPGQYRALSAEIRFDDPAAANGSGKGVPAREHRIEGLGALAADANAFYRARLAEALEHMERRGFADAGWLRDCRKLLSGELAQRLSERRALLLRVGRHSGAESITLDGIRRIRIMRPREAGGPVEEPASRTIWMAGADDAAETGLQPLGFVVVERDDDPPIEALRQWCDAQPLPDASARGRVLAAQRAEVAAIREQARQRAQAQAESERASAEAAARRAAELAAMTDQRRVVEALREKLLGHTAARRQPISGALFAETQKALREAEDPAWSDADRAALADCVEELAPQRIEFPDRKRWNQIRAQLARLREPRGS